MVPFVAILFFLARGDNTRLTLKTVVPRPCGQARAYHSRAGTRAERRLDYCTRERPARLVRVSHALRHHGHSKAEIPTG